MTNERVKQMAPIVAYMTGVSLGVAESVILAINSPDCKAAASAIDLARYYEKDPADFAWQLRRTIEALEQLDP